jgi:hypothetical protein
MMTLFVDRCYRKNHWYIIKSGSFVAGPFPNKGLALAYKKENGDEQA